MFADPSSVNCEVFVGRANGEPHSVGPFRHFISADKFTYHKTLGMESGPDRSTAYTASAERRCECDQLGRSSIDSLISQRARQTPSDQNLRLVSSSLDSLDLDPVEFAQRPVSTLFAQLSLYN